MNRSTREIERDVERTRSDIEDTVEALRDKMSIGQMLDEAGQYLRDSGGSEVISNFAAQARANPLPLAMIGIGLAWLMSGRGQPAMSFHRRSYAGNGNGNGSSYGSESYRSSDYRSSDYRSGETYKSGESYRSGEYSGSASESSRGSGGGVSSKLHQVSDTASSAYGKVTDTASQAYSKVSDTASQTYGRISDTAARLGDTYHRVSDRAGRAQRSFSEMVESEPLILAGLGLAVGAAIGAMMPASRTERQFVGEHLDDLKESASEMASEHWETAKTVARDAASAAKSEIEKGVMGESSDQPMKSSAGSTASAGQSPAGSKGMGSSTRKS
jgi:ElaB/YqjD/DUF883 family membrane-anchored ribosome-binding protein